MDKDPMVRAAVKAHPHYADGFYEALAGEPLFPDATAEYRAGWKAAWESKEILRKAGFAQDGASFSKTTVISP